MLPWQLSTQRRFRLPRAQASANLNAAQARLASLQAGPRDVDVSAKETAVSQAEQALQNLYTQIPNDLGGAYSGSLGAVHGDTDTLFNNPNSSPSVAFQTANTQAANDAATERTGVNTLFATWSSGSSDTDPDTIETDLSGAITNLRALRDYANALIGALGNAIPSSQFPQASITAGNASLAALQTTVSSLLLPSCRPTPSSWHRPSLCAVDTRRARPTKRRRYTRGHRRAKGGRRGGRCQP